MNATSLFISTTRLIFMADASNEESWSDLYRLLPYLRKSLSCTVCDSLLKDPISPSDTNCYHHICKGCKGGKKKLKPPCNWCKDYSMYTENQALKIQLQSYQKLCEYAMQIDIYNKLLEKSQRMDEINGEVAASKRLLEFIMEGAKYTDSYESICDLTKTSYSMLPSVFVNSTVQTSTTPSTTDVKAPSKEPQIKTLSNGTDLYSVSYAGSGNKITIKRKTAEEPEVDDTTRESSPGPPVFKKPPNRPRGPIISKRKGCRCGNATATPGKLTCCGQRCPCYVESKPCHDCKCKGCRNPHRATGFKICPIIKLDPSVPVISQDSNSSSSSGSISSIGTISDLSFNKMNLQPRNIQVYTPNQLKEATSVLPTITVTDSRILHKPVLSGSLIKIPSLHIPQVQL